MTNKYCLLVGVWVRSRPDCFKFFEFTGGRRLVIWQLEVLESSEKKIKIQLTDLLEG